MPRNEAWFAKPDGMPYESLDPVVASGLAEPGPRAVTAPRLLLLSNSTNAGSTFLDHAGAMIQSVLDGDVREVVFVPFAAVRAPYASFSDRVRERLLPLGYDVRSLNTARDMQAVVREAKALVVGGGNTFSLLERLYAQQLLEPIRQRVRAGVPYVGWSAGANIACPTIRTTNDMPIVEPPSLDALGLIPFQINPHYTEATLDGHAGETRDDRLLEFVAANPGQPVVGLREGTALRIEGKQSTLLGDRPARIFGVGPEAFDVEPGTPLDMLGV